MKPVPTTPAMLAFKALNRDIDTRWVEWAGDMLEAGYDSINLKILAGETEPFNQFELHTLTEKILSGLNLDWSNTEQTVKNYVSFLIQRTLSGEHETFITLTELKDLCIELDYPKYLYDFYLLCYAREDLDYSENQYYWEGATRENIGSLVKDCMERWESNYSG